MRKTIEKVIVIMLIVVMIFNFLYSNYVPVYAAQTTANTAVNVLVNLLGGVIGIFTWIPRLIAMGLGLAANILTAQVAFMDGATSNAAGGILNQLTITPFEIFFNKIQLLDVNFLDVEATGSTGGGTTKTIRAAVAKWYYVMRLIAIAVLLLILLYVGIRMAISSVASEKAIYKKSLMDWIVSLALVFLLQYIIMFTVNANSAIVKALEAVTTSSTTDAIGEEISKISITALGVSWEAIAATVVYCMIVFQTFVFLVKYLKRMLTIGFLIIISPLISITYSIDKMGDGKAQALNTWLKEFVYNVLIQPFHCIMYLAFVDVAFGLLANGYTSKWIGGGLTLSNGLANGILAILCIKFIDDGEKIVREIFGFKQASSLSPLETAAMAGVVTQGSKMAISAASNVRKGINFAKEKGIVASVKKDIGKFQDRSKVNSRTKELMDSGKVKNKEEARRQAQSEVAAARENKDSIKNIQSKKSKKQNKKIENQMMENMGGGETGKKAFQDLKKRIDAGDAKAVDEYKQKYNEASQSVPKSNHPGKKIRGAVGKVWNSNTGNYIRKTMIPQGIGLAIGSMAYGAGNMNLFTAIGTGNAIYKGTAEFAKTSTNHISTEATTYAQGKAGNKEELTTHVREVYQNGENGSYENGSDDTKELVDRLKAILTAMGQENKIGQIKSQISYEMLQEPEKFNLDAILKKAVGAENAQNQKLYDAAHAFADHQSDKNLYNQLKNAAAIGLSLDSVIDSIDRKIDYSMAERPQSRGDETRDDDRGPDRNGNHDEPAPRPLQVDVHKIVEHIEKSENIEETIHNIDTSEIDEAMRKIDDHLKDLKQVKLSDQTQDLQQQIRKFEQASNSIHSMKKQYDDNKGDKE